MENIEKPDITDKLGKVQVKYHEMVMRRMSRSDRRDNAVLMLDHVIEHLSLIENDDESEMLRDELDELKSNAEAVEFPGMYG